MSVRVAAMTQTCWACPSQWEGRTDDDRPVYVRYRWGCLEVQIGPVGGSIYDALGAELLIDRSIGDEYDGVLDFEALKTHTAGEVEWPAKQEAAR